jgi:hypothetical protein
MSTTAVTGAAAVGGNAVFSYNRANFMMDAGMRWARYMAGYSYAQDQVAMYREDVDMLSDITISKMDNIHAVSGLMMVIVIQLIMAGRLGVHGPAPPTWLMGLYWCNCALMCMWLMLAAWMAIHGGARAQAGATYLKTRSVRLPIPTPKQLDKARIYGNHWERQRVWDVFRVPFATPAPVDGKVDHRFEQDDGDSDGSFDKDKVGKKKRKTAGPITDFRTPAWVNEEIRELHGGSGGAPVTKSTTPEHFELFRGLQHEWYQFETYARVSIFFAFTHWMSAASMYIMSHCFIELRANWPAYSCTAVLVSAHYCLNSLDINALPRGKTGFNLPMEFVVPFPPLVCVVCMGIDYSVLEEWRSGWVVFIWVCSFICYIVYLLWALRMYDLCCPATALEPMQESAGKPWWPEGWSLPLAFQHTLYLVAPPKYLEPGESCLWQEMKAGRGSHNQNVPNSKQREIPITNNAAWRVCQGGNLVTIFIWSFIILARFYDMVWVTPEGGDMRYMLKQEGRVMRWPSHMQPWMSPWTRLGSRSEFCHTGGCDRRLGEVQSRNRYQMANVAENLLPTLQRISDVLQQEQVSTAAALQPQANLAVPVLKFPDSSTHTSWTVGSRPEILSCSHSGSMATVARDQRSGAFMPFAGDKLESAPQRFFFRGIDHLGEVLGSHWGEDAMLLTMKSGHLAECAGLPSAGAWLCEEMGSRLPLGGASLRNAVVARVPGGKKLFRAAVVYDGDATVTLLETDGDSGIWIPTGEAVLPSFLQKIPSFSMTLDADELVLMAENGGVLKWAMTEPQPEEVASPFRKDTAQHMVWQTACLLNNNRLARLGYRKTEEQVVSELFVSNGM